MPKTNFQKKENFVTEKLTKTMLKKSFGYLSVLVITTLLSLYATKSHATPLLPMPRNMVNDSAHLYTPAETERLETLLRGYRDTTGRDIVVVTVRDFQGRDVNDFATRLGNDWGVGQQRINNGIIFLIRASRMPPYTMPDSARQDISSWLKTPREGLERIRRLPAFLERLQETTSEDWREARPAGDYGEGYIATGRGMEGTIPDVLATRIMRNVVAPFCVSQRYAEGTEVGVYALITALAGDEASIASLNASEDKSGGGWLKIVVAVVLFWIVRRFMRGSSSGGRSSSSRSFFSGGSSRGGYSGGGGSFGGGGGGSRF